MALVNTASWVTPAPSMLIDIAEFGAKPVPEILISIPPTWGSGVKVMEGVTTKVVPGEKAVPSCPLML